MIRKNMGISQGQFGQLEEEEQEDMLEQQLWVKEKFAVWKEEKEAEKRIKMAQSGRWVILGHQALAVNLVTLLSFRYKQYRRYMKSHGSDRMTFED